MSAFHSTFTDSVCPVNIPGSLQVMLLLPLLTHIHWFTLLFTDEDKRVRIYDDVLQKSTLGANQAGI